DDGVGAREINPAAAAGRQDDGLSPDGVQTALQEVPGDDAPAAAVLDEERRDVPLFVDVHLALQELLVHGVQERMAGSVGGVAGAGEAGAAEGALRDAALLVPTEDHPHALERLAVVRGLAAHRSHGVWIN